MRQWILSLFAAGMLILALTFPTAVPAAPAANKPQPGAAAPAPAPPPHPEIREAIESLRHAREHLDHAAHDFGGHRVEAIKATDEAIRQLQLCLQFDK
jgi:hypothetical protein